MLSSLGFSAASCSPASQKVLHSIASITQELQLQTLEQWALLAAVIQLRNQQQDLLLAQVDCSDAKPCTASSVPPDALVLQEEAHAMQRWLTQHQQVARHQVLKLQGILAGSRVQANASVEDADTHRQYIELLAQKGEQYSQQLAGLDITLADVGYKPEVCSGWAHQQGACNLADVITAPSIEPMWLNPVCAAGTPH